jgi:pyruvate/2-oxoglutarate/acetoin dehydrogenase E1 component
MAKIMTFSAAIQDTIAEEMQRDPTIFTIGWYLPTEKMVKELGWERLKPSGIEETQEVGAGIGAALAGARPIVNLQCTSVAADAWGQMVVQAAKIRFKLAYSLPCPVIFQMDYALENSLHHSDCFHNWLANAGNLLVAVPATPADTVGLWRTALREIQDPVCMMNHGCTSSEKGPVPDGDYTIPFGKADIKREGKDVTIVAVGGYEVRLALEAAEDLAKQGIQAEVWDPRTLMPLDRASLIASVRKTGAMVAVDHAPKSYGTTGEFIATIAEAITPIPPMARVASMDAPVAWSHILVKYIFPSKDKIIKAVTDVVARKRG